MDRVEKIGALCTHQICQKAKNRQKVEIDAETDKMDGLPPNQRYRERLYRVIDGPNITRSEAQDVEICNRSPIGYRVVDGSNRAKIRAQDVEIWNRGPKGRSDKDWARYGADKTKKASEMGVTCNKELLLEIKMRSE
ncbi:hypothetical protein SERLA73DRAFT_157741 [Serpula lacrymans var. lacrymans S7.3]|uniref:Uncharacterized protein n=1 Tax=Serpula lacrymans var. lacrymans (strain S7.3) TaxID=936435 RepID=F8PGS2_SERL3|nr:hypothetical protein SERLA73DRAFT_157741 [Serpula lacrymans var. lacrymans S7.3]